MKYANRIKRKQFILKTNTKVRGCIKSIVKNLDDIRTSTYTLDKIIYEQIKQALDFGYEPKYYLYSNSIYHPSIEVEYENYHKDNTDDRTYTEIFETLADIILPQRLSKYTDIIIESSEDEYGRFFEIKIN